MATSEPGDQGHQAAREDDGEGAALCVLLTRTNPVIRTRTMSHIEKGLIEAGVPVLEMELHDREAFRAVFSFRQPLSGLEASDVANLDKAQANVEEFTLEILRGLASVASKTLAGEGVA